MNQIEVEVLNEHGVSPGGMMMFLAKLTQRSHKITCMEDLNRLYDSTMENYKPETVIDVAGLDHGTIKRFTPITVAIVGASRRFLLQARTHQVGITYLSGSLQYSDYTDRASFVVPYELLGKDRTVERIDFLQQNAQSMAMYESLVKRGISNDTAGYVAPHALRNVLIIQANHEAWQHFIKRRSCNRNTAETQYVTMLIWQALLGTKDGEEMFAWAGPECCYGKCHEGKLCCGDSMHDLATIVHKNNSDIKMLHDTIPLSLIRQKWPLVLFDEEVNHDINT